MIIPVSGFITTSHFIPRTLYDRFPFSSTRILLFLPLYKVSKIAVFENCLSSILLFC